MIFALFLLPAAAACIKAVAPGVEKVRMGKELGVEPHTTLPPAMISKADWDSIPGQAQETLKKGFRKYAEVISIQAAAQAAAAQQASQEAQ